MMKFQSLLAASIFVATCANGADAMSKKVAPNNSIYYSCHAGGNQKAQNDLCDAATDYLANNGYQASRHSSGIVDGLLLEFFLEDLQDHKISGYMIWSQCNAGTCGAKSKSPRIDTVVMDAQVSAHSYRSFVKSLVTVGRPPLGNP